MFHGSASTDSQWDDLGLDEAADELILSGKLPPILIVMPDGNWLAQNTSGGPNSFEGFIINELIPHIESKYCAWPAPQGRAIGGLSRGAYWSLEIAFRHPDKFVSVGAHSAALLDLYAGPDLNPQNTGVNNPLGELRIYFDVGSKDWYISNFRQLHQDMEAAGKPHNWVLNEGTHEDAYWASHLADYLTWYSEPWPIDPDDYPLCSPR